MTTATTTTTTTTTTAAGGTSKKETVEIKWLKRSAVCSVRSKMLKQPLNYLKYVQRLFCLAMVHTWQMWPKQVSPYLICQSEHNWATPAKLPGRLDSSGIRVGTAAAWLAYVRHISYLPKSAWTWEKTVSMVCLCGYSQVMTALLGKRLLTNSSSLAPSKRDNDNESKANAESCSFHWRSLTSLYAQAEEAEDAALGHA